MGTVHAEIDIHATPAATWAVLSELSRWADWTAVMVDGRCDGGPNAKVSVKVDAGLLWFPVRSRIKTWEPERAFAWGEHRGRLVRIEHGFTLEARGEHTHVVHYESFEGLIGRLVYPAIARPLTRNYQRFLEDLKARVEHA